MFLSKFKSLWKLSGSPEYYSDNLDVINIERSATNFHDDYTPRG